ncbi:MAG: hypothetical protein J4215_02930 [Candidatus Diapherotrites archaeon]|uniref:Uncharacterized protein n=1 Tax=Candidatus Iainarchaeum sp. TaxID=3101447 RepID=A0A8T4L408_9ARCH|nr:hypothetical protein [Candidatus Diapherotrites archaeon]
MKNRKSVSLKFPVHRAWSKKYWSDLGFWNQPRSLKTQDLVPEDSQLGQKIGIKPGEKVLVFAGDYGDWAKAIGQFAEVHYTDISPTAVHFVRENKAQTLTSVRARIAELMPRTENRFDWSFSFEPIPLWPRLPLVLARSLLNKKGGIFLMRSYYMNLVYRKDHRADLSRMRKLAKAYGATFEETGKRIWITSWAHQKPHSEPMRVFVMRTNPVAREKAMVDFRILQFLNALHKKGQQPSVPDIANRYKLPIRAVEESVLRIENFLPAEDA